jgi:tRNA(Ile)-lysidine synthase
MSSFSAHIQHALEKNGITQSQRVIVAVSGGADSMALLHACVSLHYDCVAAHVNYSLRGADSDADEMCVRNYCSSAAVPIEVLRVQNEHWHSTPGSTQEAARHIRYNWFNELLKKHEASCLVTAHHAKDQLETMLQQFIRGGGGKSLYGMAAKQSAIIRPMLAVSKNDILEYAKKNSIPWRNDASNETDEYTRNLIRHRIIPIIEELNPSIYTGIQQRSEWMHQEQAASNDAVSFFLSKHLIYADEAELLSGRELRAITYSDVVLWKWLKPKDFTSRQVVQVSELLKSYSSTEAALINSESHDVFIQNETVACVPKKEIANEVIHELPWSNGQIHIDACSRENVAFTSDGERQHLDIRQLTFPLTIREWQHGDVFFPLGAPGKQKVADFLTHAKTPSWKKKKTRVLVSDTTIVCVLGMRICEKFKISADTKESVRIQFSAERNLSNV